MFSTCLCRPARPSKKHVSSVSRAVMRLTSKKSSIRRDTLAYLEQAARSREPDTMQLRSHTELLPIVQVGTAAAAHCACTGLACGLQTSRCTTLWGLGCQGCSRGVSQQAAQAC